MAAYLIETPGQQFYIIEGDSARQAVTEFLPSYGGDPEDWPESVSVWTLRSSEPRKFRIRTESVTTIERVE